MIKVYRFGVSAVHLRGSGTTAENCIGPLISLPTWYEPAIATPGTLSPRSSSRSISTVPQPAIEIPSISTSTESWPFRYSRSSCALASKSRILMGGAA